jgi:cell division transport system permease protein
MLALREALTAFKRSALLGVLGVITIAFSLFAFGLFGLVAVNIRRALDRVEERVEIRAFIADGTDGEKVGEMVGAITGYPEVATAIYVSPTAALEQAKRELGELGDVFESSVLPGSIAVRMKPGARDPASVTAVANRIRAYQEIDDLRYGEEWVDKLHRIRSIASVVGLVLGLSFATIAIIIIGATIRTAVLARSREISIMRLVGATNAFIRRPFLIDGLIKGLLGGALALGLTWCMRALLDRLFEDTIFFGNWYAVVGVLAGAAIGLVGSAAAVGRQLRHV